MTQAIVRFFELRLARWKLILELALLVEIAVLFAHPILIFDPKIIPVGNEYGLSLESHVIWLHFQRCGLCFLWNGTLNGGYPAFVDLHGAPLHPLTIFATLVFGLPNSGRVIFFGSLLIAAFAQWWMGYTLGLSPVTRLWMAAIALMGGHLAGKLQMGVITLVLSIACGSLVLAAFLNWLYRPSLRAVVLLAWAVDLPPGQHHIVFRYLPREVTAGFVITLLGILLSMAAWHYAASPKLQHLIHHLREMRIEIRLLDESPQ